MLDLGLKDLIASQHGPFPITYNRSAENPLDAVFGSPHFACTRSGFLLFRRLVGDHRGIWVDLPHEFIFGFNPPTPQFPGARRLNLKDPRVVDAYLEFLRDACHNSNLFYRMAYIHSNMTCLLSDVLRKEFEEVDLILCQLMDEAEEQCRRLYMGAHPWSPSYKLSDLQIDYWLNRKDYKKGINNNVRRLITLQTENCV